MKPSLEDIFEGLKDIFKETGIDGYFHKDHVVINIHGNCINLKYEDMPKIASILGTERINFSSEAGSEKCDSVSYIDGVVLTITGKY